MVEKNKEAEHQKLGMKLIEAAEEGDLYECKELIRSGAPVDARYANGKSALDYAAEHGYTEIVELLIKYGVDVNAKDNNEGWTALHYAALHGHAEIVELLIKSGARVDEKDVVGWTALHLAAENGHAEVVELLLKYGADPTIKTKHGETPADIAERGGHTKVAKLLRNAEIKKKLKDAIRDFIFWEFLFRQN